eukprot:2567062-Rhodomonas_salina.1
MPGAAYRLHTPGISERSQHSEEGHMRVLSQSVTTSVEQERERGSKDSKAASAAFPTPDVSVSRTYESFA